MKTKLLYIAFMFSILLFQVNVFAAGTLIVEAVGNGAIYEDSTSTVPLPKGDLVQIILDRNGDGLNSIEFSGSIYPAGDDVLLPVLSGSSIIRIGDGLPPFTQDGQFSATLSVDNEDPSPNYTGYKIYVRYWDSAEPKVGSMYGEAGPFTIEGGLKPQEINIIQDYDLYANKVLQ